MDSSSLISLAIGFIAVAAVGLLVGWMLWENRKNESSVDAPGPMPRRLPEQTPPRATGSIRVITAPPRHDPPRSEYAVYTSPTQLPQAVPSVPTPPSAAAPGANPASGPVFSVPPLSYTPAVSAPVSSPTSTPPPPATGAYRLGRVLWVDDAPDAHVTDVIALHRMGLTVTMATRCEAALSYLGAESYVLVITHAKTVTEGMSVAEFVHTVRQLHPTIRTIAYDPGVVVTGPQAPDLPHDDVITAAGGLAPSAARLLGR